MINKDSIVTAYDEHLTLVEWLQKVEKALNASVLTNLVIAKLSEQGNVATYRVTATFADNTTIASNTFTLPSTNIVTAFDELTALVNGFDYRITDNANAIASIVDIIDIGNDKIKASTLQNSINGSDGVDVDTTNDKLEIHLSAELQAKLARVLLTPSSTPSTRKVVTIDTNGKQDNVDGTEITTLMSNIVDSHGNKRFIEGNITMNTIEGFTQTYGKWSLSGTHLMIVIAGTIVNGTEILPKKYASVVLPNYINAKIKPTAAGYIIYRKTDYIYSEQGGTDTILLDLTKYDNGIAIMSRTNKTAGSDLSFRIQFDLLIDSD